MGLTNAGVYTKLLSLETSNHIKITIVLQYKGILPLHSREVKKKLNTFIKFRLRAKARNSQSP